MDVFYPEDFRVDNYSDTEELDEYEFSQLPYDYAESRIPPFNPPPFGPGGFNPPPQPPPGQGNNQWGTGGGGSNVPSAPPNYIPSKNDKGVQSLGGSSSSSGGAQLKAVSGQSISFCLYQNTYIWQTNGRSYWAYLVYVDKKTVSGFRWTGWGWAYFGVDLRMIDSFLCYRSERKESPYRSEDLRENALISNNNIEYDENEVREVYSQIIVSGDKVENKRDIIKKPVGTVNDKVVEAKVPCLKSRTINQRYILDISYPSDLDSKIKQRINDFAKESCEEIFSSVNDSCDSCREITDIINEVEKNIHQGFKRFKADFSAKVKILTDVELKDIKVVLKKEKNLNPWRA